MKSWMMLSAVMWAATCGGAALAQGGGDAVRSTRNADVKAGVDAWSRGDYPAAVAAWRTPAAAGDPDAQFNLAQAYKLGRGIPADQAQATEWFRKAAEKGHGPAGDNYGLALFQDGRKAQALPWLEKSAARDEKRAELVLGTMLFNGDGVAKDWTRAYALVTRSSQQGLPQGSQTLAQMDNYIPEAQRRQGIELAREIEANGRRTQLAGTTGGAPGPVADVPTGDVPPTSSPARRAGSPYAATSRPIPTPPAPAATPRTETPRPTTAAAPTRTAARPAPRPAAPAPAKASGGPWKVQLGAFRDAGNARGMWAQKGGRTGGSPSYATSGGITRLFATGFASRAEAQRACARAGGGCIVTR